MALGDYVVGQRALGQRVAGLHQEAADDALVVQVKGGLWSAGPLRGQSTGGHDSQIALLLQYLERFVGLAGGDEVLEEHLGDLRRELGVDGTIGPDGAAERGLRIAGERPPIG